MKLKLATVAAIVCTAVPSMGIIKLNTKSTVNKDGSAKFTADVEIDLTVPLAMTAQAGAGSPLRDGKKILVEMIKGIKGNVDVWSDAKAETKGAVTRISVSGFTKDWRGMGDLKKAIVASGQADKVPIDDIPEIKFMDMKNDSSGNTVITMAGLDDIGSILNAARQLAIKKGGAPKPGEIKVNEAEIAQGLAQLRAVWQGYKAAASPLIKGISLTNEIEVSGTISSSQVFKKTGENTATFSFSGEQLLSLVDQIVADEKLPGKVVALVNEVESNFDNEKSVTAVKSFLEPYVKTVYGGATNPRIVITPGPDAFDYAAESEKAKAGQSAELKTLIEDASKAGGSVKLPDTAKPKKPAP